VLVQTNVEHFWAFFKLLLPFSFSLFFFLENFALTTLNFHTFAIILLNFKNS
jgi:hypothetical protein